MYFIPRESIKTACQSGHALQSLHIISQRMLSHCFDCVGYIKRNRFITTHYLRYQIVKKALRFFMPIGKNCSRIKRKLRSGTSQEWEFLYHVRNDTFSHLPMHNILNSSLIGISHLQYIFRKYCNQYEKLDTSGQY